MKAKKESLYNMRLFFITIFLFVVFFNTQITVSADEEVRCPTAPSDQGDNRLFSFFDKNANLVEYIPKYLVLLDTDDTKREAKFCLTQDTYDAFLALNNALYLDTGESLIISSAWRSLETQEYFAKHRGEFAAIPGRSEHQLGTAIDVDRKGALEEDYFGDSNAYLWMKENAHLFGFVQSFTLEYQELTGTPEEPWHWRFVGKDIAKKIQKEGLNVNQYLYDYNNKKEDLKSRSILSQASELAFNKIKNFIMIIYSFLSKH